MKPIKLNNTIIWVTLFSSLLFFVGIYLSPVYAIDSSLPNNKFGIHLAQPQEDDILKARDLVNSQGGDWGYITLVIQEDDRNKEKWQGIFDKLRELHLIPIIRLATKPEGPQWRRPVPEDVDSWVNFLSSLNWVVKERYVILFNEPNHALEWGGSVDAVNYGEIAKLFAQKLRESNTDYIIMLAGLDASAPSQPPAYQDEGIYLKQAVETIGVDSFNELFGGLSSHSYANPGFVGPPIAFGKGTVRTYVWEQSLLGELGIKKLPVFITETGWDGNALSRSIVAQYTKTAFENVWLPDEQVVAVTPFILNYQGEPFANFSWAMMDNKDFYPQYYITKDMPKLAGTPARIDKGEAEFDLPKELLVGSIYRFPFTIKNTGQTIWDKDEGYSLQVEGGGRAYFIPDFSKIKPMEERQLYLYAQTIQETPTQKAFTISLFKGSQKLWQIERWNFTIEPPPDLSFRVRFFPPMFTDSDEYEIQIFDDREQLVYKQQNVSVAKSTGLIKGVPNVLIDRKYRIVIMRPNYAPRQTFVIFQQGLNEVVFPWMLPIDFNVDGRYDGNDIRA